ncbi:DUF3850 domain-containing protein [Acidisoma cellulosilytica]|uniref:DUF3850 domain-containing protein n=1 Tax=Acidisoma cellulosilyticum TaxID=2802395 RepID=A0A963YZS8_9PROT|nr:DUF3850 domain-containing protein [Acidisoma cellulosilyticum]
MVMTTPSAAEAVTHVVKCAPQFFAPILEGTKTAEARFNDRDYRVGNCLSLMEWDGEKFTGLYTVRRITHILRDTDGPWLRPGFVMLSLGPLAGGSSDAQS